MAYVEPLDSEVGMDDPLGPWSTRGWDWELLVAITLCLAFWTVVIATFAELV
jgi:hypothetical protein